MTVRKIVQIVSCGVNNTITTQCDWFLHALCDDGSVIEYHPTLGWHDLPPIPHNLPPNED